jgi:hypothetical protein
VWELGDTARLLCNVPDIAGLEIGRGSRENCRGESGAGLAAIHDALGHRGKLP